MHIICPSMPIPTSTELTEFFVYFVSQKITAPPFGDPLCWRPGYMPPTPCYWMGWLQKTRDCPSSGTKIRSFVLSQSTCDGWTEYDTQCLWVLIVQVYYDGSVCWHCSHCVHIVYTVCIWCSFQRWWCLKPTNNTAIHRVCTVIWCTWI